jgi:hypothetical protein
MTRAARRGRRGWPRAGGVVIAVLLALGLSVSPPVVSPADAAGPLQLGADAVYTLDPDAGRVRVAIDVEATNLQPPSPTVVYYYRELVLGIQPEAARIRVSDPAGALDTTIRRRARYVEVTVALRALLFHEQTTSFRITYDLVGGAPRSESPIRVGAAYATFGVWSWGDAGLSRVEVRTPRGFGSQVFGGPLEIVTEPDGQRLVASPEDPSRFYAVISAENVRAYDRTHLSLDGGVEVVIMAWPEDDAWESTVTATLHRALPELQALVGLAWPVEHDLRVRERFTPLLDGYAGVFYADQSIDVSEDLDPHVIVHEASHAWFDERLFAERWIYEGLADEYAWRALVQIGQGAAGPQRPALDDPARIALSSWSHPEVIRDQETGDRERFGYAASWWVVHEIVEAAGETRLREAFAAAQDNLTAYPGAPPPESVAIADGWRRLLDLTEDPAEPGSVEVTEAFRQFVLRPGDAALLDDRAAARQAYRELLDAGAGWLPPWYVRQPLGEWRFDVAEARILEARAVLGLRDEVAGAADALDLRPDAGLEPLYEVPDGDFAPAVARAEDQLEALAAIDEARRTLAAERDLLTRVGLLDAVPEAPYEAARAAFERGNLDAAAMAAAAAVAMIGGAAAIGQGRILLVAIGLAAAVLLLVLLAWLVVRRRRRRQAAIAAGPGQVRPYATLAADPQAEGEGGAAERGSPVDP